MIVHGDKHLTAKEFDDLALCIKDIFHFSSKIYVRNPVLGKVQFKLYPYQKLVLWYFLTKRFNLIKKFRQAGLTELISLFCLWLAMYFPGKNIQIVSIKDRVAKRVLGKIKYMYRNLEPHLQTPIINGRGGDYGTATEIEFSNGSLITSIPTTEDAGRSEALTLLVIDEGAILRWASQIWAAAFPTLSTGGSAIVNSTPYGVGGWYHQTYTEGLTGGNPFNIINLKWRMHPERDDEWYETMRRALGPKRTAQEIDGDFLSSGDTVFDLADIKAIEDTLGDYPIIDRLLNGNLLTFKKPKMGQAYFIGADVASGRSRDYSTYSIQDTWGDEVECFKGKIPPDRFAELLMKRGKIYNNALIGAEANDIGLACVSHMVNAGYPELYYTTQMVKEKGEAKPKELKVPGFLTTKQNRPVIIEELESDIRNEMVNIKNPFFVQEAYTFIYGPDGRPVAMGKDSKRGNQGEEDLSDMSYVDDSVFGESICNYIRKRGRSNIVIAPQ